MRAWVESAAREVARLCTLGLLLFLVLVGVLSIFEKPFRFTPTEVDFLCAGPFRRRQLVNYKIGSAFSGQVLMSFLVAASGTAVSGIIPVFVGSLLLLGFLHLFALVAGSLGSMLGLRDSRSIAGSCITLVLLVAVTAVLWFRFGKSLEHPLEFYRQLERSPVWRAATSPLRGSSRPFSRSGYGLISSGGPRCACS